MKDISSKGLQSQGFSDGNIDVGEIEIKKVDKKTSLGSKNINPKGRGSYSRFVFLMKVLLHGLALILIITLLVLPQIRAVETGFSVGIPGSLSFNKSTPSMLNARFIGADKKKQPFSITADLAKNLALGSSSVELEMPQADIVVGEDGWLVLTAKKGVYNQKFKKLTLNGSVNLFHDSGYEFETKTAEIDFEKGVAHGSSIIDAHGPFGHLSAEGFVVETKSNRIFFSGKSKLTLFPSAMKAEK
ncbi:MAG: LPS export ABC transporter periplasmic protein LptC [Pseudomonadota bacterium]|nr:LPS export ABC transporter periplasmic protein LptC [Pseudomonadota bacterium]